MVGLYGQDFDFEEPEKHDSTHAQSLVCFERYTRKGCVNVKSVWLLSFNHWFDYDEAVTNIKALYDMGGYLLDVSRHYSSGVLSYIGQTCLPGTLGWFSFCGTVLSHLIPSSLLFPNIWIRLMHVLVRHCVCWLHMPNRSRITPAHLADFYHECYIDTVYTYIKICYWVRWRDIVHY